MLSMVCTPNLTRSRAALARFSLSYNTSDAESLYPAAIGRWATFFTHTLTFSLCSA